MTGMNKEADDFPIFNNVLLVTLEEWNDSFWAKLPVKETGG